MQLNLKCYKNIVIILWFIQSQRVCTAARISILLYRLQGKLDGSIRVSNQIMIHVQIAVNIRLSNSGSLHFQVSIKYTREGVTMKYEHASFEHLSSNCDCRGTRNWSKAKQLPATKSCVSFSNVKKFG